MGGSSEKEKQREICEDELETLDNKIEKCLSKYKYDHYSIFLLNENIRITMGTLEQRTKNNPNDYEKFKRLTEKYLKVLEKYESIRGEPL